MAANFYVNVSAVSVGETALSGVQSITVDESGESIAKYGDGDIIPPEIRAGRRRYTTTIVTNEINHGISVSDSFRRVSFTSHKGEDQNLTVATVVEDGVVTSVRRLSGHDTNGNSAITVEHTAADGSTSPLSIS